MADVIKTESTAFVVNANGLLLTKISLKNVRHYSPSSFRSQLLTTGRPDPQVSQYCTNNYKLTNKAHTTNSVLQDLLLRAGSHSPHCEISCYGANPRMATTSQFRCTHTVDESKPNNFRVVYSKFTTKLCTVCAVLLCPKYSVMLPILISRIHSSTFSVFQTNVLQNLSLCPPNPSDITSP